MNKRERKKRWNALALPYHKRKDAPKSCLLEIDQAIDLEEKGWKARRDWDGHGGLHLSHPDFHWLSEISVAMAMTIEEFAVYRAGAPA